MIWNPSNPILYYLNARFRAFLGLLLALKQERILGEMAARMLDNLLLNPSMLGEVESWARSRAGRGRVLIESWASAGRVLGDLRNVVALPTQEGEEQEQFFQS